MQIERRGDTPPGDYGAHHNPGQAHQNGTEFTLRWHHHDAKLADTMIRAWEKKQFIDVTLASGHRTIGAHKLVLCACSSLLESMLIAAQSAQHANTHPMLYFHEIDFDDLAALVDFMYRGHITVTHHTLPGIIHAAQILKIRGLSREIDESVDSPPESSGGSETPVPEAGEPSRKRIKKEVHSTPEHDKDDAPDDEPNASAAAAAAMPFVDEKQQQLAAFLSALAQQTPLNPATSKASPAGPSPSMRSRLVWDPAHIVYLENWYMKETRYPSIAQCQLYANTLSQIAHSDQSGKSRSSISVTAQNVSHWFQNRRRKDTHPEIEEKRVKRSQTRKRPKTGPLDLTQPLPVPGVPTVAETPLNMSTQMAPFQQPYHQESHHNRYSRDSDDEPGLCIAEQTHSDAELDAATAGHQHR